MSDSPCTITDLPGAHQETRLFRQRRTSPPLTANCSPLFSFTQRQRHPLTPLTANCSPLTSAAFTLIEIVLSLGIIAFALVGIMGMLPIALNTARESAQESEATLIAQRIFAEIRNAEDGKALITTSASDATLEINLEIPGNYFLAFGPVDSSPTTGAMVPLGTLNQGDYDAGLSTTGTLQDAQFIARLNVIPENNEPTRIVISIEAPAFAASDIRSRTGRYPFVSLVSP